MKKNIKKFILAGTVYSTLLVSAITVKADIFAGGFATGVLTVAPGTSSSTSITQTALAQWNNVSSKVKLTYTTTSSTAKIVTHFQNTNAPTAGLLGQMVPYKTWTSSSGTLAGVSDVWVKALVYQYKSSYLDTTVKQTATATHEIGHALSIAHPTTTDNTAIMRQGIKTSYTLGNYDKTNLISKWGN